MLGLRFQTQVPAVRERIRPGEAPSDFVVRMALEKALAVSTNNKKAVVISADTLVVLGPTVLGKPRNEADAARMLRKLSGREHSVLTGVALYNPCTRKISTGFEKSEVRFAALTRQEIQWYVGTGEGFDKAGGYAIQGKAAFFIEGIGGSSSNVIGLPIRLLYSLAAKAGLDLKKLSTKAGTLKKLTKRPEKSTMTG